MSEEPQGRVNPATGAAFMDARPEPPAPPKPGLLINVIKRPLQPTLLERRGRGRQVQSCVPRDSSKGEGSSITGADNGNISHFSRSDDTTALSSSTGMTAKVPGWSGIPSRRQVRRVLDRGLDRDDDGHALELMPSNVDTQCGVPC